MAPDSPFRARLRDALRQSAVGRPQSPPGSVTADPYTAPPPAPPSDATSRLPADIVESDSGVGAHLGDRVHYEFEDAPQHRTETGQSAWIADALGGAWEHDGQGVCLIVDRVYAADRRHGSREIGWYADTLERHADALYACDKANAGVETAGSLFPLLDDRRACERDRPPGFGTPGLPGFVPPTSASVPPTSDSVPSTSDFGLRTSDAVSSTSDFGLRTSDVVSSTSDFGLRTSDFQRQFLFFDLETTGLSGGAGTCAFLIGFGWFHGQDFRTRQYLLAGYGHEAAMLRMACHALADNRTLASFNGKTFDIPLIQGRYLFHRLRSPFDDAAHIDLLQPARRLWRHRPLPLRGRGRPRDDAFGSYFRSAALRQQYRTAGRGRRRLDLSDYAASCALGVLEDAILGFSRRDDVPGAEIPSRYFHYARTGDARQLLPVLEHNRLDLVSLAAVGSIVARMLHEGADATRNAHECLALGRMYERSGAAERAAACYQRAIEGEESEDWNGDPVVQREALRCLAVRYRRERRFDEAAAAWQRVLDLDDAQSADCAAPPDLEALLALAIHHEHRSKDLPAARAYVVRALAGCSSAGKRQAFSHRLARLDRKIGQAPGSRS